jgi:hypothetical protein
MFEIMSPIADSVKSLLKNLPNLRSFIWFFLALLLFSQLANAQEKLNKLVLERQQLHQQWQQSETKKSGIFGNRTKKDMVATNDWMARIIQKDNQIMEELELLKKRETTEISHEKEDYKFIAQKQQGDIGILKRSLESKELELQEAKSKYRTNEWIAFILFLSTLTLGYLYFKGRKNRYSTPV